MNDNLDFPSSVSPELEKLLNEIEDVKSCVDLFAKFVDKLVTT